MLVDGGPSKSYERNHVTYETTKNLFTLLNELSDAPHRAANQRLESLSTVVVTHDDADHMNGSFHDVLIHFTLTFPRYRGSV